MSKPPLWEVMRAADSSCASDFTSPEARAIIAMRDWLVPEEEKEPLIVGYKPTRGDAVVIHAMWKQRQYLRALLTAEADRAERGELQP